jgi:hypothetical protein
MEERAKIYKLLHFHSNKDAVNKIGISNLGQWVIERINKINCVKMAFSTLIPLSTAGQNAVHFEDDAIWKAHPGPELPLAHGIAVQQGCHHSANRVQGAALVHVELNLREFDFLEKNWKFHLS